MKRESIFGFPTEGMIASEIQSADYLYCICDAEFGSRKEVHASFAMAKGVKSWARHYLLHEVQKVAQRDNVNCSYHTAHIVATRIAEDWYACKEEDEKLRGKAS